MADRAPVSAPLRIAVVGTVGVPARYGGFETLAEQLARHVDPAVVALHLYGQRSAYDAGERAGAFAGHPRHFLPLAANGAPSLAHDALAMLHAALVVRADAMLVLGTSGAWALPLLRRLRPGLRIVVNIDGLEWRRDKFGGATRALLKWLERRAVRNADAIIADNAALLPIIRQWHGIAPALIAYGGDHSLVTAAGDAPPPGYWLAIARIEPENNAAMILEAAASAGVRLVFVGNWHANGYGQSLRARWGATRGLLLLDPIYDLQRLAALRAGACGYVHGHSVGGTNPSLVEAIFHTDRVLAYDCAFNRATLDDAGGWFCDAAVLATALRDSAAGTIAGDTLLALRHRYRWRHIADAYLTLLGA